MAATSETVGGAGSADAGPATGPHDAAARAAIRDERRANVAVTAGAGTGKTRTLIERAVALLAPPDAQAAAIPIQRMALITFTRRAAGELRFRIREHLLREVERVATGDTRRAEMLRAGLANLDAAFIGTIHGFADRLLRLRPVEADLSPAYALVDDTAGLVRETVMRLRHAAEAGSLHAELGPSGRRVPASLVDDVAPTLQAAARAGVPIERAESVGSSTMSVEGILARMIEARDVPIDLPPIPDPGITAARAAAAQLARMVRLLRGHDRGHRRLRRIATALQRLDRVDDPPEAYRIVHDALRGRALRQGADFGGDVSGWDAYKAIRPDGTRTNSLADRLKGPHRWLAARLVRLLPVVVALYDRVKSEHEVVDYLDLLLKLRNVLRDNLDARRFYQGLFDHVCVDEFQDTDPLQCEIVFYLCEDAAANPATRWDAVCLAPGKLTVVGDPKQSIYRFRRADIAMYGRAMARLRADGAIEARLDTNFRSRPALVDFFNARLGPLLGVDAGPGLDLATGRAPYEPLRSSCPTAGGSAVVHVLPYADGAGAGLLAPQGRPIEAAMIARYVRWLLDARIPVRDPDTAEERPVRSSDIAVLACVTTNLHLLLHEFDRIGLEYAARGGALFLGHPVVRRYLLALRAVADRGDGVAEAALLQPPFFAVDWRDAVAERQPHDDGLEPRRVRMQAVRAVVQDLRARRHRQPPGATARDLIERTALGRVVSAGPNGRQTLAALYDIAAELDRRAAVDDLDYDAVTELCRAWARDPGALDAAQPVGAGALRVVTVHGAKGLEFPVVILWDGFQTLNEFGPMGGWYAERDGHAWALSLGPVAIEQPPNAGLFEHERTFAEAERRRLYYVAATRARDLLVLPVPQTRGQRLQYATAELAGDGTDPRVLRFETFQLDQPPLWGRWEPGDAAPRIVANPVLQAHLDAARATIERALAIASQPVAVPVAASLAAVETAADRETEAVGERTCKAADSRFGVVFGLAVHRALELLATDSIGGVGAAVAVAIEAEGLTEHQAEARDDVERTQRALQQAGFFDPAAVRLTEYPVTMRQPGGRLVSGYADLVVMRADELWVVDYKTTKPRSGPLARTYPDYAAQLRLYGRMLEEAALVGARRVHLGVLFTATGELRWLDGARAAAT